MLSILTMYAIFMLRVFYPKIASTNRLVGVSMVIQPIKMHIIRPEYRIQISTIWKHIFLVKSCQALWYHC